MVSKTKQPQTGLLHHSPAFHPHGCRVHRRPRPARLAAGSHAMCASAVPAMRCRRLLHHVCLSSARAAAHGIAMCAERHPGLQAAQQPWQARPHPLGLAAVAGGWHAIIPADEEHCYLLLFFKRFFVGLFLCFLFFRESATASNWKAQLLAEGSDTVAY